MPQADFIKLVTANVVAAILAIGAPTLIVLLFIAGPVDRDSSALVALLGGLSGAATTYLWQTNTTAAVRGQTRRDLGADLEDDA